MGKNPRALVDKYLQERHMSAGTLLQCNVPQLSDELAKKLCAILHTALKETLFGLTSKSIGLQSVKRCDNWVLVKIENRNQQISPDD